MTGNEPLHFHYDVDGNNFTSAGEASVQVKRMLRQMGFHPDLIRRISVAMYEGEINMVIHAKGGDADVYVTPECITAEHQHQLHIEDVGAGGVSAHDGQRHDDGHQYLAVDLQYLDHGLRQHQGQAHHHQC